MWSDFAEEKDNCHLSGFRNRMENKRVEPGSKSRMENKIVEPRSENRMGIEELIEGLLVLSENNLVTIFVIVTMKMMFKE